MIKINNAKKAKKSKKNFDMGSGTVWSVFKQIWIPSIISALIAGTFTVFDTIFISLGYHEGVVGSQMMSFTPTEVSQYGVAAMSYATPYTFIIIGIGVMLGAGIAQRLAKAKAQNNELETQRIMNSYLPSMIIAGSITGGIFFILAKPLIWMGSGFQPYFLQNWFNVPIHIVDQSSLVLGQQFSQATWYLRIQALGAIPYMIMVSGALILRVSGSASKATKYAFYALLTNLVFDALFIGVLGMNLIGASIATVIAQSVAMVCYVNYFRNKGDIKITNADWAEAKTKFSINAKLGNTALILQSVVSIILLSTTMSIGFVFYNQIDIITLYQSSFQGFYALFSFANMVLVGTALTMQPIVVFNYEKGLIDRVHKTKEISFLLAMGIGCTYAALMIFFPPIVKIFVSPPPGDEWSLSYAQRILQMLFLSYIPLSYSTIAGNYLQAKGEYKISSWIVYLKPLLLFPLMLSLGFGTRNVGAGTWINGIYPLEEIGGVAGGGYAPLGIFWGFMIAEIPSLCVSIFGMHVTNKNDILHKSKTIKHII